MAAKNFLLAHGYLRSRRKYILYFILLVISLFTFHHLFFRVFQYHRTCRPRNWPWSIGVYLADNLAPLKLCHNSELIQNPVLSFHNVSDVPALFVADPFVLLLNKEEADRQLQRERDGRPNKADPTGTRTIDPGFYLFFEFWNDKTSKGDIGAAWSADGLKWEYRKQVLEEDFHLSYPFVFQDDGEIFMIPETYQSKSVRLYKAVQFPEKWEFVTTLLSGEPYVDSIIWKEESEYYLFTLASGGKLRLFYSKGILEEWIEHPDSPIVKNNNRLSRLAGRIIKTHDGKILRFAQDGSNYYGEKVYAARILQITPQKYVEEPILEPILLPSSYDSYFYQRAEEKASSTTVWSSSTPRKKGKWNHDAMHQVDALLLPEEYRLKYGCRYLVMVDGCG